MSGFRITAEGLGPIRSKFKRSAAKAQERVRAVNEKYVPIVRATLISHSSGRPGPEVVTGAYNAAYDVHLTDGGMGIEASNPSPQSARLEFGFVGTDALDRMYHQPAFPHFRPTILELGPPYTAEVKRSVLVDWWA